MPEVWIPPMMRQLTGGVERVQVQGASVGQVISNLEQQYPGISGLLLDDVGEGIRPGIAVVVDGEVARLGMLERVRDNSEIHFLPAIGGGRDADNPVTLPPAVL
jgi:molybdopterin synthase sulfur carrier subunit